MMRIKIYADYVNPDEAKQLFERVHRAADFPDYGPDKKLYFIGSNEKETHAIVINWAKPDLSGMSKWNVIGLAHEPVEFLRLDLEYVQRNVGIYYVGRTENLASPFVLGQSYLPHSAPTGPQPEKTKIMSLMISQKTFAPGHKYRHQLATAILQTDLKIDIYGRGCVMHPSDPRLKEEFKDSETMLKDYRFHICIENFESDYYFSEKVIDPVCYNVTPIYMGCLNIDEFFPDMIIKLTGDLNSDMELIRNICEDPDKYVKPCTFKIPDQNVNLIKDILDGKLFP